MEKSNPSSKNITSKEYLLSPFDFHYAQKERESSGHAEILWWQSCGLLLFLLHFEGHGRPRWWFLFIEVSVFTVMIEWREGSLGACTQTCCWVLGHKEVAYSFKRADPRNRPFFPLQLWTHRIQDPMTQHLARDWTMKWTGSERLRKVYVSSQGWWYLPREPRRKICGPARLPGCLSL